MAATTSTGADTFAKLLVRNAVERGARPAVRQKAFGIWQTWSWAEVLDEVRAFATGLRVMGLERGDRVAIIGANRPRLYWTITAAQSLGAVPVPIYQDSVAEEMRFVLAHAGVRFAVVENQEQVDKVLSISDRLELLEQVIFDDERGLETYDQTTLHDFATVQARGREKLAFEPDVWQSEVDAGSGRDLAVLLYTSGTTGEPKGVMLSFDNVVESARMACAFDRLGETEELLAYLPMAWIGDHVFSFAESYVAGFCVACPESPETVLQDLREIGPTFFFAPPRIFETILTRVTIRMADASLIKRWLFHYFLAVAQRSGEDILNGRHVALRERLLYAIGRILVYEPLKNVLGFSRIRVGYTAGEAIGPEIFRFYRSLGMNLKQLYGQTESSVFIAVQADGEIRADTVGRPAPGVAVRIDPSGEVLYRSPGVFQGYYKNEAATRQVKTPDGWVRTGDAGFFDSDGHLCIIDRAKDVGRLTDGTLFAPKYIENKLKFFPDIKEAIALGHDRNFVAVMLTIDMAAVGNWAERSNVAYASYQELAGLGRVYDLLEAHVCAVNRDLAAEPETAGSQIHRFLVLPKELDADDGELTRTQKVRRSFIAGKYGALIDALYSGARTAALVTEVTFEDGRKGVIRARVAIREVPTSVAVVRQLEAAE